jgi:hypothetical protein
VIRLSIVMCAVCGVLCAPALAQPPRPPSANQPEIIPPEVLIETMRAAYGNKPTAEEVTVRVKGPRGADRADDFIIRIDPGPPPRGPGSPVSRARLEMGPLTIAVSGREVIATASAAPGKYFSAKLSGPLTADTLAQVIPPIPAPELALASADPDAFKRPLTYTGVVTWTRAAADPSARPPIATMIGTSASGTVAATAGAASGRLTSFKATVRTPEGEMTLDLSMKPIDPGDPATWLISTDGRERVATLAELRPAPGNPPPLATNATVPDLVFQHADFSNWNLYRAVAEEPSLSPRPLALVLYRAAAGDGALKAVADARAGWAAIQAVKSGALGQAAPLDVAAAAALVMELGQFSRERWEKEQQQWGAAPPSSPELLWANSAAQSIDRFDPKAAAVLVVIGPDHRLIRMIPLDGRAAETPAIAAELRAAMSTGP